MISAEEALVLAEPRRKPAEPVPALTDEETVAVNYLDSTIESSLHREFNGGVFSFPVPASTAKSFNVIKALVARYTAGNWLVGVQPMPDATGEFVAGFNLMFAPKQVTTAVVRPEALPAIVTVPVGGTPELRVLVRMPTRERWPQALRVLAAYRGMAGMPITLEVVVDYDDATLTSEVLYRLSALACTVTYGNHKSKVEACNGGRVNEWDILVLASDDMVPVKDGWARRVVELFEEHWPHLDGALHFNDGAQGEKLCTLSVMGKRLWMQERCVYAREYKSLWCDREYTEVLQGLKRLTYVNEVLIEHQHPAAGKAKTDALYVKNDALWAEDKATYDRRKALGYLDRCPVLSILICSTSERREMCGRLYAFLYEQAQHAVSAYYVEIFVDDRPATSIGAKRQRLLERANGDYVCFVDDDDWVDGKYVDRIVTACVNGHKKDAIVDCVSFSGVMTINGNFPQQFEHSIKYTKWENRPNLLVRTPNHLNPVRRVLALETGFTNLDHGEDKDYADRLRPRLKTEASAGDAPLYFYWKRDK